MPSYHTPAAGAGSAYKVDGECIDQCDCGPTNPCAEYIFDHRGGVVEGRNFTEWFVNEYVPLLCKVTRLLIYCFSVMVFAFICIKCFRL